MTTHSHSSPRSLLDAQTLEGIRSRAAGYDERNEFFSEDLEVLSALGYLKPRSLADTIADQRLLAAHAPATALGVGMHLTWMGVARDMVAQGFTQFEWILEEGAAGELFAFGVSERGNSRVLADSTTVVEETAEGFEFSGTKIFVSLSPAWTRLSLLGRLGEDMVHGFIDRDQAGWSNTPDWDTLGMRATQSYTTTLEKARVRLDRMVRRIPVGDNTDLFTVAVFQNFLLLVSSVYAGIADRALELAVEGARNKGSAFDPQTQHSDDPDIRWQIADMAIALDSLAPQLQRYALLVDAGGEPPYHWFRLLSGVKHQSVEAARSIVDGAMRVVGGSAYRRTHELSRLQRDVLAGVYHPSDTEAVHSTVAHDLLGPAA
ncbi:MAG: acyl-CoA dehydrogenase family protein [Pontimonas sp.]